MEGGIVSKDLILRLREAAAQRVASTAMIGADDLSAAADALESLEAAYASAVEAGKALAKEAFKAEQGRDVLVAELKALREQEPVGVVDESDDGLFADLETPDGVVVKQGDKLYAHPVPARKVTDAIKAIGRRSTPMRADEGRSPLEFDNSWNQCLDAIERYLKGESDV